MNKMTLTQTLPEDCEAERLLSGNGDDEEGDGSSDF